MKTKEKIMEEILENAFEISINLNDTFFYSTSDSESIYGSDYIDLIPLIQKFGYHAEIAYCALKRGYNPEISKCLTKEFFEAKQEISDMIKNNPPYEVFFGLQEHFDLDTKKENWSSQIKNIFKKQKTFSSISELIKAYDLFVGKELFFQNGQYSRKYKIIAFTEESIVLKTIELWGKTISWQERCYSLSEMISIMNSYKKMEEK